MNKQELLSTIEGLYNNDLLEKVKARLSEVRADFIENNQTFLGEWLDIDSDIPEEMDIFSNDLRFPVTIKT